MKKLRKAILEKERYLRLAKMYEMGKTYEGSYEDIEALSNALDSVSYTHLTLPTKA